MVIITELFVALQVVLIIDGCDTGNNDKWPSKLFSRNENFQEFGSEAWPVKVVCLIRSNKRREMLMERVHRVLHPDPQTLLPRKSLGVT